MSEFFRFLRAFYQNREYEVFQGMFVFKHVLKATLVYVRRPLGRVVHFGNNFSNSLVVTKKETLHWEEVSIRQLLQYDFPSKGFDVN